MNWNECIETNDLTWMNWNEWLERNELPKSAPKPEVFFTIFMWNRALATVSCTFCRPHIEKVVRPRQFLTTLIWNGALATVSCTLCRLHLQKVVRPRKFLTIFIWNWAPATVSCTLLATFRIRRAPAETNTLQRRPRTATLPEKNIGFCARVFSAQNLHVPDRLHSPTTDDYLIDMMMWLTWWLRWWCGCHDGETASHWQSTVNRKFPN